MSFVPHVTPPPYLLYAHFCLPGRAVFTWKVNDGFSQINDEQGRGGAGTVKCYTSEELLSGYNYYQMLKNNLCNFGQNE